MCDEIGGIIMGGDKMGEIIINQFTSENEPDDPIITWYRCPRCESREIIMGSRYCSSCGGKISWKKNIDDFYNACDVIDRVVSLRFEEFDNLKDTDVSECLGYHIEKWSKELARRLERKSHPS